MSTPISIIGLFFADNNNLVYEKVKHTEILNFDEQYKLKVLPLKFLGPIFLTHASTDGKSWMIKSIEATLSLDLQTSKDFDTLQSFFILNSSIFAEENSSNLIAIVTSSYTEDIKVLREKLRDYIHPSVIQGKIVNVKAQGKDFNLDNFVNSELERGIALIDDSLGQARKLHWEKQQKYYILGIIERIFTKTQVDSYLFTFDAEDPLRKQLLEYIPSYYIMAILPQYYEMLITDTLEIFGKTSVLSNIRQINLGHNGQEVVYLEEFTSSNEVKKTLGFILISENDIVSNFKNISFYKKKLRSILDGHESFSKVIYNINTKLNTVDNYLINSEDDLNLIKKELDSLEM